MTTVSIITVSYNSAEKIRDTIESVRRQTYPHIEYIIVDGGSTDGTVDIIKENEEVIDRWVSEPDDGIYDAMNKGIRMSTGDVIGILNSDDWYEPGTVDTIAEVFEEQGDVDLVHGAMRLWTEDGAMDGRYGFRGNIPKTLMAPFNHPTCFVRRSVYEKVGLFDTKLSTASDYDFMIRFKKYGYKEKYVEKVLTNFRKGGATSKIKGSPYNQIWYLLRKNGYSLKTVVMSLVFRILRDIATYAINYGGYKRVKKKIRHMLPYRTEARKNVCKERD